MTTNPSPPDWRGLCEELADKLSACWPSTFDPPDCLNRARAALAAEADGPAVPEGREPASVVGEPSDAEIMELMPEGMRDEFSYAAKVCSDVTGGQVRPRIFRVCLNTAALEFARAVLARYGHQPEPPAEGEVAGELTDQELLRCANIGTPCYDLKGWERELRMMRAAIAADRARWGRQPEPPAVVAPGPSMEDVGPLIAWLTEQAHQAADASQPTDAGMLTWAAQVIGERVDEDAPAPPAEGEVTELARLLRLDAHLDRGDGMPQAAARFDRAADLLEQRHPAPVPVADRLPGPEDCDAEGLCWVWNRTAYTWGLFRLDLTAHSHWLPATALPQGEVEP